MSEETVYAWKTKFGDIVVSDTQRIRALEDKNRRLKRLLAGVMMANVLARTEFTGCIVKKG